MASTKTLLYYGALLHDIGKIVWRGSTSTEGYALLGAEFVSKEVADANSSFAGEDGRVIAEQIRFHNQKELEAATSLPDDSLAYITAFANLVSMGDSREREVDADDGPNGDRDVKLRKIFNSLNGHHDDETIEHDGYASIRSSLRDGLVRIGVSEQEVGSVIGLLDSVAGSIPASNNREGLVDVPFCDHARTTAGIAACVYEYLRERGKTNYRDALGDKHGANDPGEIPMFLLYSCDMSGIQDFIYNVSGSGALKQLRARSMYLELLLEHIADELLERLGLCRANLLYSGGGHAYLLLPNTNEAKSTLASFGRELNAWFVEQYRTDLYVAGAWVACCANDLANRDGDKGRYPQLYRTLSRELSEAKAARYDAKTIRLLNYGPERRFDHSRECSECHRSDLKLDDENKCTLCSTLGSISRSLMDKDAFVVEREHGEARNGGPTLALPFGCRLRMCSAREYWARKSSARRVYVKGSLAGSEESAIRLWMGDYAADTGDVGISAYATQGATLYEGIGIKRLGVLRADVDDLGATFVAGLPNDRVHIGRTSTLSRALSYFFKSRINGVLSQGGYQAQIIYSGGDDLFIIGNWSDVIYAAMDIRKALDEYTGNGSITLSAGIGMFGDTYPIARMAAETGELEDAAKHYVSEGTARAKNAIALWSGERVFGWDEFTGSVEPRMREVRRLFGNFDKGTAFVYRLIDLLRDYDSVASAPRLAYLLARSFEDDQEQGAQACRNLYAWAQDRTDRRRLVTALEWYVCSNREGSEL